MSFKTTYVLFAVLLALLGVFFFAQVLGKKPGDVSLYVLPSLHDRAEPIQAKDIVLLEIAADPSNLEIAAGPSSSRPMKFVRAERGWRIVQPDVRADERILDRLVHEIISAKIDENAEVTDSLKEYGLEPPGAVITLVHRDKTATWRLNVGNFRFGQRDAVVYVTSSDRPKKVMVVDRRVLEGMFTKRDNKRPEQKLSLKNLNDFRPRALLVERVSDLQSLDLQDAKQRQVIIKKTDDSRWTFDKPPYGPTDYDPVAGSSGQDSGTQMGSVLSAVAGLRIESDSDFVDDNVKSFVPYGLGPRNPEVIRVVVKVRADDSRESGVEKEPVTEVLVLGGKADDAGGKYFALLEGGKCVVKVPGKARDQLLKALENPNALRSRDLVPLDRSRLAAIDFIDIQNADGTYQLRKTGPASWELMDKSGQTRKAESAAVAALLEGRSTAQGGPPPKRPIPDAQDGLLAKQQIKEFPAPGGPDEDLGLDKPSAVISLWVDGFKSTSKEEAEEADKSSSPKKEKTKAATTSARPKGPATVKLVFGKKVPPPGFMERVSLIVASARSGPLPTVPLLFPNPDKALVYVRRELTGDKGLADDKVLVAVTTSLLEQATRPALTYLDLTLPTFTSEADLAREVTSLHIVRGSETFEVEKATKDGKSSWKFKQPSELANKGVDTEALMKILAALNRLRAERWLTEKPADSDLAQYGLNPPQINATVVVTKGGKPQKHVYLFGKETPDKKNAFARLGSREAVFTVLPGVLATLKGELRDYKVFPFDPASVRGLKLTGWKGLNKGANITLDLERDAAKNWTVKAAPQGFKLDEQKAEDFLLGLPSWKLTGVVKGPAKNEYELGEESRVLLIAVTLEGEQTPLTLIVGKLDAKAKAHYAQSSATSEVFMLPSYRLSKLFQPPDKGGGIESFSKK